MLLNRRGLLARGTVVALALSGKPVRVRARSAGGSLGPSLGQIIALRPPRPAPAIAFKTADGTSRTLADYRGKPVLLNLWATWCVPCVKELPSLAALAPKLRAADVAVLPISTDRGGADHVTSFMDQHGITGLPVLIDTDPDLLKALGARGLPTTYLIDGAGRIVGLEEGGMDWDAPGMPAKVTAMLAGAAN